jgi:hypothetical protein
MKIEYFAEGSSDCPLVLLFGPTPADVSVLSDVIHTLSQDRGDRLAIHDLPGFYAHDGCRLFASSGATDLGLKMIGPPNEFEWSLRPQSWENVAGLLEPFARLKDFAAKRFQYLDERSEIRLLISTERSW